MKRALILASVASMIDQFNMDNIAILKEEGYEVHVACNFKNGNTSSEERMQAFIKELKRSNISICHVPIPRSILKITDILKSYHIIKQYMNREKFDLVHCHSPIGGVVGRVAARRQRKNGCTVLYTAHGFHFFKGAPLKNWVLYYPIEKICALFTDIVITINKEDYRFAKRHIRAKKIEYIPGIGVDVEQIKSINIDIEKKKEELHIPQGKKIVLSVGELSSRKNTETVIRAFAALEYKESVLLLCGKGKIEEKMHILAKQLGVMERVIFAGYRIDILKIYKIADVFLFPSKQEGLPVAMMQAMAAGVPVVASNIRGNTDLMEEAEDSCLFSCMNVTAFANKIDQLFWNKELSEKIGMENQKRMEKFDRVLIQKRMREIYETDR